MSVQFVVEPAAISAKFTDLSAQHAIHQRMMDQWERFGVLLIPNDSSDLKSAIEQLPQDLRKRWQVALTSQYFRRKVSENVSFPTIFNDVESILKIVPPANLACLEENRIGVFGLPDGENSFHIGEGSLELCRLDTLDVSQAFQKASSLWRRIIRKGTPVGEIWHTQFKSLAQHSRRITIIDRYALEEHVKAFQQTPPVGSPLFNLLKYLNAEQKHEPFAIEIFTAQSDLSNDYVYCLKKACDALGHPRRISSLYLFEAPIASFKSYGHDRYIRFDQIVTSIGRGVSLFDNPESKTNFDCNLKLARECAFIDTVEKPLRDDSTRECIMKDGKVL